MYLIVARSYESVCCAASYYTAFFSVAFVVYFLRKKGESLTPYLLNWTHRKVRNGTHGIDVMNQQVLPQMLQAISLCLRQSMLAMVA